MEEYEATTTNASDLITATPVAEDAEITIILNGEEIPNESAAVWDEGINSIVINVKNDGQEKDYYIHITYYPEVEFTFSPTELTADSTYGLSSDTVTIQGIDVYDISVTSATADNEHITVVANREVLTVSCDDDSIFTEEAMPFTVTVTGFRGNNPASGTFEIVHS